MGYKVPINIIKLIFEDMPELEIRIKTGTMAKFLKIARLYSKIDPNNLDDEGIDKLEEFFRLFASNLHSWNLEDDEGKPLPLNAESLMDLDPIFMMKIIREWIMAIKGVDADLGKDLRTTNSMPVVNLPMASNSISLGN